MKPDSQSIRRFFCTRSGYVLVVCAFLLSACSRVMVPEVGAVVPCQIQSIAQVEQAIFLALQKQGWTVHAYTHHVIQVRKAFKQMRATVDIAYGYKGFSLEYVDSQQMNYHLEDDTIDPTYKKWIDQLLNAINQQLKYTVDNGPVVTCLSKNIAR
ncbi:MAG: hypothetical protein LRY67_05905 [Gammaproteobacteria bacterium]|nr:hypothetical protein [Gammaproteobacteria bacterium]MCD8525254.1 hypothetical protein [Gammaproteobacteria bacterium]MCD8543165.1 hypothetical protein [Gammaproteobacteria bacterium]